jgi:hypothetical protein
MGISHTIIQIICPIKMLYLREDNIKGSKYKLIRLRIMCPLTSKNNLSWFNKTIMDKMQGPFIRLPILLLRNPLKGLWLKRARISWKVNLEIPLWHSLTNSSNSRTLHPRQKENQCLESMPIQAQSTHNHRHKDRVPFSKSTQLHLIQKLA